MEDGLIFSCGKKDDKKIQKVEISIFWIFLFDEKFS